MERIQRAVLRTCDGLEFAYPTFVGSHDRCQAQIQYEGLQTSSFGQLVRILYDAKVSNSDFSDSIEYLLQRAEGFSSSTTVFYGGSLIHITEERKSLDLLSTDELLTQDLNELTRLHQTNGRNRTLDYRFLTGKQSAFEISRHPLIAKLTNSESIATNLAKMLDREGGKHLVRALCRGEHSYLLRPCTIKQGKYRGKYTIDCTGYGNKPMHTFGIVHDPLEGK
nr:hypothetical protein [Nanoarchaeum sp.]